VLAKLLLLLLTNIVDSVPAEFLTKYICTVNVQVMSYPSIHLFVSGSLAHINTYQFFLF